MLISSSTIAGIEHSGIRLHVGLSVALMVMVDTTSDGGPGTLEHKNTFGVVSFQFL
jgi:hypothetical protein